MKQNVCKIGVYFIFLLIAWMRLEAISEEEQDFKYNLAICAIFRDDAPYLQEWIEFHRLVGVDHFFLYNHMSEDNFKDVLQSYIDEGIVELVNWSFPITETRKWVFIQTGAYNDAIAKHKNAAKWIAFIDTDEFLFATECDNLVDFLKNYEEEGGLAVNWQTFGTSHIAKIPDGQLMIETLLYKAEKDFKGNKHVKSIVNPRKVAHFGNPHYAYYKRGSHAVTSDGKILLGAASLAVDISSIRINHYWTRDEDYFYNYKIASRRKRGWSVEGDLKNASRLNEEVDTEITRFVPALREKMAERKKTN